MKKNGFTLIETIGVIFVIALIATVTIPIIISSSDRTLALEQEKADIIASLDYYFEAHHDLKLELMTNGEIILSASDLVGEDYINEINYYKNIKVKYNANGTYEITNIDN